MVLQRRIFLLLLILFIESRSSSTVASSFRRNLTLEQAKGALGRTGPNDPQRPQNNNNQNNFYYYANGNRVSNGSSSTTTTTKAASSFYDDRKFSYFYTTKLSDLYWCLFVVLGWTVWMMHSIHSLRQSGPNPVDAKSPTPQTAEEYFPIFRQRYDTLLHVRGHVLDVISNPECPMERPNSPLSTVAAVYPPTHTLVVDYVIERQPQTTKHGPDEKDEEATEMLQIRKYFETSAPAQVGFANIDLLILPDDPMCAMLQYDYEAYQREEEGIQRVIQQEQFRRRHRRKRHTPQREDSTKSLPIVSNMSSHTADPTIPAVLIPTHPLQVNTAMENDTVAVEENNFSNLLLDEDDEDWFGLDICRDWFDCSTIDTHQWRQMSLFFATLLVFASGMGCVQVVRRMDPKQRLLGWVSLFLAFLIMVPTAIWIHRVLLLCQRWSSEQSMEKQGFIVQSSTMTGTITSRDDHTSMAEACRLPSCTDAMEDFCDRPGGGRTKYAPSTAFSYVVPELSGCYFIRYPTSSTKKQEKAPLKERPLALDAFAPTSDAALVPKLSSSSSSISSISEGDHAVEGLWNMARADRSV